MKSKISDIILIIIFLIGLSLLAYPTVSDYWNSIHQSQAVQSYTTMVEQMSDRDYDKYIRDAQEYNTRIKEGLGRFVFSEEDELEYNSLLNISGNGVMGYIEIPDISVTLPIYHTVDESVLAIAVGHIEGTSLPVGGEGTHCVLSGHRGLPSAKLFTDLDKLAEGDTFMLHVLDQTLTYEVDQVRIVLPHEIDGLSFVAGMDLCTLVTCTPYGINSHRLLVRGVRTDNRPDLFNIRVTADAVQIEPVLVAPVLAVPVLMVLLVWMVIYDKKRR